MNKTGIEKTIGFTQNTILYCEEGKIALGVVVGNTGVDAGSDGKKIIKAGTPIEGDLTARTTAMEKIATPANAIGILTEDVDVTAGNANASVYIAGVIDLNKIDSTTAALIDADVKGALKAVHFVK